MFNKVLSNGNDNSNGNTNSPKESETAANGAGDESTAYASADPVQHSIKNITAGFYHHHLGSSAFMTPDFGHNAHFRPYEQYTSSFDYHYQNGSSFKNFPTQPAAPTAGHQPQNFVNHQLKSATETGASFGPSQPSGPPSSSSTASNSMSSSASPALNESPNPAPAVVAALYHSAVNAVSDPIQASKIAAAAAAASSYPYNNSHIHHSMFGLSLPTYPNQADYSSRFYQGEFLSDYEKNSLLQNTTSQTSSSSSSNASSSSIKSSGHLANKLTNSNSSLNGSQSDSSRVNRCRICDKTYARPSTLKTHMRTHSGEKPYKCDKCSKAFTQAANLTAHLRTHSGEKPFSCEICGRKFSQSSSVTTHMRTHSGERPYACKFCRKAFSDSSTLTKHMRVHSGEKPYQCQLCQLRFSQSGNLNRHMRIHQNQQQNQQHHPTSNGYAAHMASNMMRNNDNTIEEEDENEESMCSEPESQSRIRPDINEEDRFNDYYQRNLRQHQQFQHQQLLYQQQPLLNQPQMATEDSILHTHSSMQPFPSHHLQQQHLHPQFSHQNSNNFGQNFGFNQHQSGLAFGHHFHHQSYLHPSSESADVVAQHAQQLQLQQQLINIRKMECVDYNNN